MRRAILYAVSSALAEIRYKITRMQKETERMLSREKILCAVMERMKEEETCANSKAELF